MATTACTRNIDQCALKSVHAELAMNQDDDREALTREVWVELLDDAQNTGDEFYDYDGPLS